MDSDKPNLPHHYQRISRLFSIPLEYSSKIASQQQPRPKECQRLVLYSNSSTLLTDL
ncbi:conserved hypothetical protein [Ricinus communis]|uniref:Uncharacterized protein n=1 Tax=Ricinus communis TaxID=3988 RepID=B9RI34_RICCO|nr:conserved hypothetical protein [Ricinus communis]